jgi:hypothetical protein
MLLVSHPASQQPQTHMHAVEMSSLHNRAEKVMARNSWLSWISKSRKFPKRLPEIVLYGIYPKFCGWCIIAFSSH